jgi:anti-sigma factor RsiW
MTSDDREIHAGDDVAGAPGTGEHMGPALSASLDLELEPAEARQVEEHLDGCPDCRAELASLERVRRIVRELPPVGAPAGFVDGLVDRRHRATRRGAALVGAAASLLVVLSLLAADPLTRSDGRDAATADREPPIVIRADNGLVRLESHDRDGNDEDSEPSLLDRAQGASRDLLDFLAG